MHLNSNQVEMQTEFWIRRKVEARVIGTFTVLSISLEVQSGRIKYN